MLVRGGVLHLAGHEPIRVPIAVALRPGTTTVAPLRIDLGPAWPAGEVAGELEVGGTSVPVTLLVEPAIEVDVSPGQVLCAEGRSTVELTVRNDGNVAIPLAARTRGRLLPHDADRRAESPGSGAAPTRAPRDLAGQEPDPQAQCRLDEPVLLAPGDSRRLTVHLEIPTGLDPTRRHRAVVPVGPADLLVTVLPTDPRDDGSRATT
jgi:hypothetical protein